MDILTIGEVLIDLTQTGKDEKGISRAVLDNLCAKSVLECPVL